MMNGFVRTLLFVSAIAPAVLVAALLQWWDLGLTFPVAGWLAASAIACIFPFLVIVTAARRSATLPFSAKKVESQEWILVGVVFSYFLPLILKVKDPETITTIVVVAGFLLATLDAIPSHPVLHLFRYRFYKAEGTNGVVYVLITRRRLLTAADIKNVQQLSPNLLLEA
jgi:hypothetical protein